MTMTRTYVLNPDLTPNQLADAIVERFNKLQALVCLCQTEDFTDNTVENINNCLWLQGGLLMELRELFDKFSELTFLNN